MQVCYFTGDMRKVDWQKPCEHRKPTVIATPSLDTLSIRGLPSSTRPDWRGRVQGKDHASFGQAVTLLGPLYDRTQMDSPDILRKQPLIHVASEGEEKEKEWQWEYERARETEEDREQHIFQGTAPCCSNLIVFSEKGWSVREIHLFFSTGKCGIDRWTLCSSVTAQCKVMQERQTHSLYHKKVCSCLRSVSCMRIHELHWPPFNTFSWDEYRQWCYASISCENHLRNCSKTLLIVVSTLPHSHIIQSLDTLIPCQNLYHFISFKLQLQTLHGNILQTFKLRNESSRWD